MGVAFAKRSYAPQAVAGLAVLAALSLITGLLTAFPVKASTVPVVTSVSPNSGTVSGGTPITITGTGFTGATQIAIGGVTANIGAGAGDATLTGDTTITWTTPVRANTTRTAGAELVTVTTAGGTSTDQVYFTYRPVLGTPTSGLTTLGNLAVASQSKPVSTTTSAPYVRSGTYTDARPNVTNIGSYSYVTDYYYNVDNNCSAGGLPDNKCLAYANESDERALQSGTSLTTTATTQTYDGRSNVLGLTSSGNCAANPNAANSGQNRVGNTTPPVYSFCSVFGPEVSSEAFYATTTDSLSFDWAAVRVTDDYEIYAYLVKVPDLTTALANTDPHTIVAHSVGKNAAWTTSSAPIPTDGYYRFRFVNGSYDGTGGLALGSNMYIDPTIAVGLTNTITFPNPGTQTATFDANVSASSGSAVTVTSSTPSVCSVTALSATQVTVTRVLAAGSTGTCTLTATQGAVGTYAPAAPVTVSFSFSARPTPTVTAVSPTSGTTAGGTSVTITGTGFENGATVTFGTNSATNVTVVNSTTITATTPAGTAGLADVTVTNTSAQVGTLANAYTYVVPPPAPGPAPAPPTPTPIPTPTPVPTNTPPSLDAITGQQNPNVPTDGLPRGDSLLLVNDTPVPVTVKPDAPRNPTGLDVDGPGFTMQLSGRATNNRPLGLTPDGALILEQDRTVVTRGTGFEPNSQVFLWVLTSPTPRFLGTVATDSNGSFSGSLPIPLDLPAGRQTLQANGLTPGAVVRSLSLGVQVNALTPSGKLRKAKATVYFAALSPKLDATAKRTLRALIKGRKGTATRVIVNGFVQANDTTENDVSLSRARARAVAKYLRSRGVDSRIVIRARGVSKETGAAGRKTVTIITYRD